MPHTEKAKDVLGTPVFPPFSENTLRVRRNLIAASSVALFLQYTGIAVQGGNFFGLKLENLTTEHIELGFFLIVLYNFLVFAWRGWDHLLFAMIRVTGNHRLEHKSTAMFGNDLEDYPSDHQQTSLYRWWKEKNHPINKLLVIIKQFEDDVEGIRGLNKKFDAAIADKNHVKFLRTSVADTVKNSSHYVAIRSDLERIQKLLSSDRIHESLSRFDKWFYSYQSEQKWRWLFLELLFPILLGGVALYYTCPFSMCGFLNVFCT